MAVYPHARGDDGIIHEDGRLWTGPPPRAWGRLPDGAPPPRTARSTPTRVGTTSAAPAAAPQGPVHPHARGDDGAVAQLVTDYAGPPPRAWGRLPVGLRVQRIHRSTPTRVGTTRRHETAQQPRRSTPTRVGTTGIPNATAWSIAVHPHARGDDWAVRRSSAPCVGPPPRAWGRRPFASSSLTTAGPPPRAWGRPRARSRRRRIRRSTPTRVGTTPSHTRTANTETVHPHARGDDCPRAFRAANMPGPPHARGDDTPAAPSDGDEVGPPPRAWGRRYPRPRTSDCPRSTPTRVGTTCCENISPS